MQIQNPGKPVNFLNFFIPAQHHAYISFKIECWSTLSQKIPRISLLETIALGACFQLRNFSLLVAAIELPVRNFTNFSGYCSMNL
jgi:hypothetical protein